MKIPSTQPARTRKLKAWNQILAVCVEINTHTTTRLRECPPKSKTHSFCNNTADANAQTFCLSLRIESASRLSPTKHFFSRLISLVNQHTYVSLSKPCSINWNITSLWQQQHLHLSVCQPKHFTSRSQPNAHVSLSIKTSLSLSIRNSRLSLSNENTQPLSLNQNLTFLCQPKHFTSHV